MIAAVTDHITEIESLCRRFGVRRLVVFGSAVDGTFRAGLSDVDFLVELDPPAGQSRFDAYFGLKEALESLLRSPVDLVDPSALRNPYLAATVRENQAELYAA